MAMTKEKVEAALEEELQPGEEVLWQGAPKPFKLLENDNKKTVISKWIGGIAAMICVAVFCMQKESDMKVMVVLLALLLGFMLMPLLERRNLLRYRYWITNQRILLMSADGIISGIDQELIDSYEIVRGQTGGDCLVMGSAIMKEAQKQLRWQACHPRTTIQEEGPGLGLVFYALEDADKAAASLLCRQLG